MTAAESSRSWNCMRLAGPRAGGQRNAGATLRGSD